MFRWLPGLNDQEALLLSIAPSGTDLSQESESTARKLREGVTD